MKKLMSLLLSLSLLFPLAACSQPESSDRNSEQPPASNSLEVTDMQTPENFVLIKGGSFQMGSPESEAWRSADETQHSVTVSDFYMSKYELTQKEYEEIMGNNPSNFLGETLPVENVSWDRSANGYRLPTEAEWEYACHAGTTTAFYMENSPSAEEANYYGHYPYEIEDNYFSQGNLQVQPGEYRQTTVPVDSFSENPYGLYNMHGNVSEWVWDYYSEYSTEAQTDPAGPAFGTLRVYRGGGWNDFAKNMRSAYRATLEQNKGSFNLGIRFVLNAAPSSGSISGAGAQNTSVDGNGKILIAYFSWGGNTEGVAEEIQRQTGVDLFEITMVNPYSNDYNTVLDEAQRDQSVQARPELATHVENMDEYAIVMIGYPNW